MNEANEHKAGWKQKFIREAIEYYVTFVYLLFFFGAFAWYRRLILAHYQISYVHYGIAFIEALVMAKVILVGDALRLGRSLEDKPLIFPTLYKAFVFTLFVAAFEVLEHTIGGLLRGKGLLGGLAELAHEGIYELLAGCLVTFSAFVPFFAFRELGRVMAGIKVRRLFFRKRKASDPEPSRS